MNANRSYTVSPWGVFEQRSIKGKRRQEVVDVIWDNQSDIEMKEAV